MRRWLPVVLVAAGLLVARAAGADEIDLVTSEDRIIPAGTVCREPAAGAEPGAVIRFSELKFAVSRTELDQANACRTVRDDLTGAVIRCTSALAEESQPEPGWRVAGRWALITAAVVGAFFVGVEVGR